MATLICTEDTFPGKDGICCDRCAAGEYMRAECGRTKKTDCAKCGHEFYTATKNSLTRCNRCKVCDPNSNHKTEKPCTAQEDTVCGCKDSFYCKTDRCDQCLPITPCPPGKGVKVHATRMNNTICARCEDGTFSNVEDFHSPCQTHTRCEGLGRELKERGTETTDAICGNFKSHCPWILPAGLWSGLVLTALVLFGLVCWRLKRKSYKPASSGVPVSLVEMGPAAPITQLEFPLPFTELNGHCQESCAVEHCKLPLFNPDETAIICGTQDSVDSVDSNRPITPLKVSVSFAESIHTNGYSTSNFLRTHSEPQEDEYCGT